MSEDDTTTGIPDPDEPGRRLVPPWPADSTFTALARHFIRHYPWGDESTAQMIAYFEGCLTAFDAADARDPAPADQLRWRADLRASFSECVRIHRERDTAAA